jgi:hypothetical protein
LRAITPKDFAELVGVIASQTDATPVHRCLRHVAFHRIDELSGSRSFVNVIGAKHLAASLEQQDGDGGQTVYRNLQAAVQLATFSANMFRVANQTKSKMVWENARLLTNLEDALETVELFREQIIKTSTSLHKSEDVHSTATEAIQVAQKEALQAKKELFKLSSHAYLMSQDLKSTKSKLAEVEDQVVSVNQALEKADPELEIVQNESHNHRKAFEKLDRSVAAKEVILEQQMQDLQHAISTAKGEQKRAQLVQHQADQKEESSPPSHPTVENLINAAKGMERKEDQLTVENWIGIVKGTQRKADQLQTEAREAQKEAVREQEKYTRLQSQLQGESEQAKLLLDEANHEVQRLMVENKTIREQDKEHTAAALDQAAEQQRRHAMWQAEVQDQAQRDLTEANKRAQRAVAEKQILVEQQKELQGEVSQARRDFAQANHGSQLSSIEAMDAREQSKENTGVVLNQPLAQPDQAQSEHLPSQKNTFQVQQTNAVFHHNKQVEALQTELNRANLHKFTMQRTIDDLQSIILNSAGGGPMAPGF